MKKYIFITGGVVSSIGKGILAASLGCLLKNSNLKIVIQKFDPYINIDPGTLSPYQHGEVFVTDDGTETDLDLGHYERFIDINLCKFSSVTTGKIYSEILLKERQGKCFGETVQVIPHITNIIKKKILNLLKFSGADIIISEIGGTVGDIESLPFLEAIRQIKTDVGYNNVLYIHVTYVPFLKIVNEFKTKPTQHSVKELRSLGIQPNILVLRTEKNILSSIKNKVSKLCDVELKSIFNLKNVKFLYSIPLNLKMQCMDTIVCKYLNLKNISSNMKEWEKINNNFLNSKKSVIIAIIGKYTKLFDAYLSLIEALKHAGLFLKSKIDIKWIDAEKLTNNNINIKLNNIEGILIPGGFGDRGIYGKILSANFARKNNIPFLGICLGMQIACIEFARNVIKLKNANSTEFNKNIKYNIIDIIKTKNNNKNFLGGTLRLGSYLCFLKKNSYIYNIYNKQKIIKERHRHRYEFNNKYIKIFEKFGMIFSGFSEKKLVEIIEYSKNNFFIGCQFHPEFISRPNRPHFLFIEFIKIILKNK